jgi:hypothetical protein
MVVECSARNFPLRQLLYYRVYQHGVNTEFTGEERQQRRPRTRPILAEYLDKVRRVIADDVLNLKKAMAGKVGVNPRVRGKRLWLSPISAVPKKWSEKIRVVHNLSWPRQGGTSVNAGIKDGSLNISNFGHACRAVVKLGRGCLLIKLDVEAAYKQVPVRPEDWHLLGFEFEGVYYYERVLPFGLRSSCKLWELFAHALHWLCEVHLKVKAPFFTVHYVDDFLFVVSAVDNGRSAQSLLEQALSLYHQHV